MGSPAIFVLLPVATYLLLIFLFARKKTIDELLNALTKSHLLVFAFVGLSTEILSALNWIDFRHVCAAWAVAVAACTAGLVFRNKRWLVSPPLEKLSLRSPETIFSLGIILFLVSLTFATAVLYPPNNWDSMTYHMARVAEWISHHNVSFYPTNIERQNFSAPLAEFAILHLQVLSDSDRFANLVQWLCYLVCIGLGVLITAEFSPNRWAQMMTAVVIATIPMSILQSTSTQNDLVTASFVLAFTLFMLRLAKEFDRANFVFASLSLGLALLTKATAYLYCGATGLVIGLIILGRARSSLARLAGSTAKLCLICLIALLFNAGHFIRSYQLYGVPVSDGGWRMLNGDVSLSALLASIPKNLSLHLGTTSRPLNQQMFQWLRLVMGKQTTNLDNNLAAIRFGLNPYSRQDDFAGNPVHLLAACMSLLAIGVTARRQSAPLLGYALALVLAAVLFCFSLKWQPWGSRLHTALFMLSAPMVAIALAQLGKSTALIVIVVMAALSFPFVLYNERRPLITGDWEQKQRSELYFTARPELCAAYTQAVDLLATADAQEVGLLTGHDDWEYPLWILAKEKHA